MMRLEIPASSSAVWGGLLRHDVSPAVLMVWLQNSTSRLFLLALVEATMKSSAR